MNDLQIRKPKNAVMLPNNKNWVNRFEVHSETSDRIYIIAQRISDGTWGCSCPGWRRHRHCKHLNALGVDRQVADR